MCAGGGLRGALLAAVHLALEVNLFLRAHLHDGAAPVSLTRELRTRPFWRSGEGGAAATVQHSVNGVLTARMNLSRPQILIFTMPMLRGMLPKPKKDAGGEGEKKD